MENTLKISIKAARVNSGLTLLEAAEKLNVGKDRLMKWEKNPGLINGIYMEKIANTYNIPLDNLNFLP